MDEGGIYEDGTPEQIFDHPEGEKTRRFIRGLKILEMEIHNSSYDYPGMQARIIRYCEKNQIPRRMDMRLQLIFEETVQQLIIPVLKTTDIRVVIEYSEETGKADYTVCYGGERADITMLKDQLPVSILKSAAENIRYTYCPEEELSNQVTMTVR
ncbi:MAG TPA: hypothetical protein DCL38_08780 [Lachnospiraceae bacterium]|nr:hypothetical protein [Lachnospiraceae bacterium]